MQSPHPLLKELTIDAPLFQDDEYLRPHFGLFKNIRNYFNDQLSQIIKDEGSLLNFAEGYKKFGFTLNSKQEIEFREWLPEAKEVYLYGDFNEWNDRANKLQKQEFGVFFGNLGPKGSIPHDTKIKLKILNQKDQWVDRIPAYIPYAIQNEQTKVFDGVYREMLKPYEFKNKRPAKPDFPTIYEVHIGMSSSEQRVSTYKEFAKNILPRVHKLGYNCIQLMAIQEHAYYGSFGYHVTNYFAPASRQGPPEDLCALIDEAHGLGITVLMDIVHSHASSNAMDGIGEMDGSGHQYFHEGAKGHHSLWDSKIFNYSQYEVKRFLLSNIRYWMEIIGFDGFRFDGVTSMLYHHHGIGTGFTGNYQEYFGGSLDHDSVTYLMLAATLAKEINPGAMLIAEDVSGLPGLCRSVEEGGFGFEFRLAMALPDKWIKLLKESSDEQWDLKDISHTLTNRRWKEKCIAYAESHDQAIVGDKTLSMWLFDEQIYTNMSKLSEETIKISRGMALHKMIRILTLGLGGEGYLTFIGNEFGHPEWVDFPSQRNNWSYLHCRRQWNIADDPLLRYGQLQAFDEGMIQLEKKYQFAGSKHQYVSLAHNDDKVLAFERGDLVFVFNFHPNKSYENYKIGTHFEGDHECIFTSDEEAYGGYKRVSTGSKHPLNKEAWNDRRFSIFCYLPSRSVVVFRVTSPSK